MVGEALDTDGDGVISRGEFEHLVRAPPPPAADAPPKLVLFFDVNQTVLILDSAIGAGAEALLNMVIANAAWGRVEGDGAESSFALVSTQPELVSPAEGLMTYAGFVSGRLTNLEGLTVRRALGARRPNEPPPRPSRALTPSLGVSAA